jgi:hypothetical protein
MAPRSLFPVWACLSLLFFAPFRAHAAVAFLMEEPYGRFGAFNPTGHAALYLNHVCADTPTHLRLCHPGETGVVLSRYYEISGDDWIAMPLIPYLYAVEQPNQVPDSVTPADLTRLQTAYWSRHLTELAPSSEEDGTPPLSNWRQLVGESYIRRIRGFQFDSSTEQDERLIVYLNDHANRSHFNLITHNCADFSRNILNIYFPHSIHRNFFADAGIMTPKQVARSLVHYGRHHPELHLSAFVIDQVPGSIRRSHGVHGVAESLIKSKRYLIPLIILDPEVTGAIVATYLVDGRLSLPSKVRVYEAGEIYDPNAAPNHSSATLPTKAHPTPTSPME